MISWFFINRPIFAAVLSIVITLAGGVSLFNLGLAQFPPVTPPTVQVTCTYPGASAQDVAEAVAVYPAGAASTWPSLARPRRFDRGPGAEQRHSKDRLKTRENPFVSTRRSRHCGPPAQRSPGLGGASALPGALRRTQSEEGSCGLRKRTNERPEISGWVVVASS